MPKGKKVGSKTFFAAIFSLALLASLSLNGCGGAGGDEPASFTTAQVTPSGIAILAWDAVGVTDLSGYRIYYGTAPGTYLQALGQGLNVGNVTSHTVTGLNSRTRYYFAVTAYDTANNESAFSNEVFKDIP
jgi:fibronectin type 3 domain-containing protein